MTKLNNIIFFKSLQLNISFNESATTTFEYPSETSILLSEDNNDSSEKNNSISTTTTSSTNSSNNGGIVGQKTPNGIHGSVGKCQDSFLFIKQSIYCDTLMLHFKFEKQDAMQRFNSLTNWDWIWILECLFLLCCVIVV